VAPGPPKGVLDGVCRATRGARTSFELYDELGRACIALAIFTKVTVRDWSLRARWT
jgi:hypothetical protein